MVRKALIQDTEADPQQSYELLSAVSEVRIVIRTLTSAEILALATPIVLVPQQAGVLYVPILAVLVYHDGPGPVPYTFADDLVVGDAMLYWVGAYLDQAGAGGAASVMWPPPSGITTGGMAGLGPTDLTIWTTGNPTLGDGTIDVTVLYSEVDVS